MSTHTTSGVAKGLAVALFLGALDPAHGEQHTQQEHNKALIQRSFEAWKAGAGGPYDLLAEDASWTIAGSSAAAGTYPSREAFLRDVIRPFNARMHGHLKPAVHNIYADGDAVIIHFEADGVARDGKRYHNSYAWFLEVKNDRIVRALAFFDSLAFNDLWSRIRPVVPPRQE